MAKKKKEEKEVKNTESRDIVNVSNELQSPSTVDFDKASMELQQKRHETIGSLFDRAASVIDSYLKDPDLDLGTKMITAKLASDIYMAQEKFKREDKHLALEERRLYLEEIKANKASGNINFNQQNNFYSNKSPEESKADLTKLKKEQDEILSSYIPKNLPQKN